jgi:hypothetical protein
MSMSVVIRYYVLLCFYAVQYLWNMLFVGLDWIAMGCGMWKSVGRVLVVCQCVCVCVCEEERECVGEGY